MKQQAAAASLALLLAASLTFGCSRRAATPQATPQANSVTARAERPQATSSPAPSATLSPAILAVWAKPRIAHAGDTVTWRVKTTTDVERVDVKAAGFIIPLEREAAGRFVAIFRIPYQTPGLLHGTYHVEVVAETGSGAKATSSLTMKLE